MARSGKLINPGHADIAGYSEFELDVESVLRDQLPTFFKELDIASLSHENVQRLPIGAKGAYVLFHRDVPVYAGKTDARHGFRNRLERHWYTLQHRKGLLIEEIGFKAVRVMVFSNFDVEAILINELRRQNPEHLTWNDSGFGSNDVGRNREAQEPADFDTQFPIDIDKPLGILSSGTHTILSALTTAKTGLPYLLRYETDAIGRRGNRVLYARSTVGHADQRAASIEIPGGEITTRQFMEIVVRSLPGWQATVFPDRIILYRENRDYPYALEYIR